MKKLFFSLLLAVPLICSYYFSWGQINIIPVRTDVSGFTTWTDDNIGGTTYLQLLLATSSTVSPAMDFNSYTGETLNFKARTYGGTSVAENTITVSVSTDNGGNWTVIGTRTPTTNTMVNQATFDLSSYNGTQVKVKFTVAGTTSGVGAGIDDISITGYLPTSPTITVNPATISGLNYVVGNGPSAEQTFVVSGTNLTNNINLSTPADYEISVVSGSGFGSSLTLAQSGGIVANTTIYVRLIAGLPVGTYNNEVITASSTGATDATVTCNGIVTNPADPLIPTSLFEIQNILVDACAGSVEGQNEMVIFQIGPTDINVNGLRVDGAGSTGVIETGKWPNTNNSWLGISPPPSNPSDVAYINSTITSCGYLVEPVGGILQAGEKILMITSTDFDPTAHSFATLQDTLYVIFQNAGNTQGHFVNYGTTSERTFVLTYVPTGYADTIYYDRSLLVTQLGIPGAEDGGAVSYTWGGTPTYYNNGCQAPYIPMDPSWNFATASICETDPSINLDALVTGTTGGTWSGTGVTANIFNPAGLSGNIDVTYTIGTAPCTDSEMHSITVNTNTTPLFTTLGPYCVGDTPASLPATSTNSITGTWSPATISTATAGTTVYTFTPAAGQCALSGTMPVTIASAGITPVFASLGPYCMGATPASLPATSINGITGTWSPSAISTASAGTTVYTFTPATGQCATTATMSIVIDANITPVFTTLGPYCMGATPASLPATSTNGITGTWSPAAISTASAGTTVYTFTPTAGQCATTTTMSVVTDANITPVFTTLGPYCMGATPASLPATSTNGITGTWSPAAISTASTGTTVYTFTPTAGQCATTATMSVVINANITPGFTTLGPYCVGATPASLPATSANGITGTWSPAAISTASAGTTVYTFTPTAGQCATTTTMSVVVNANITPGFTTLGPYCVGATPASLPATSTNGITGTWSPAAINTASAGTTVHTFTPTAGQCATTTTMSVVTDANITPVFTTLGPYCMGATPASLPATSTNGITGTWSPAAISTASAGTTVYTFTPTAGQCATTATMSVVINSNITPTFTTPGPYCVGGAPASLPATSTNGITGTWSPATINTASAGTTVYTFTPSAGQCATTATMSVSVNANITPGFTTLGPYCVGAAPASLPATSTNGITGTWSPAAISTASAGTTVYTFTPTAGQCATTTTMSVITNANITPAFTALGPYCVGAVPDALPAISTNGITGTWSPTTINTTSAGTTVYTFTPTAGQCATTTTLSVVVDANITPTFTTLGPYCVGATPDALPVISTNGITGTWSPATINTASAGTTVYSFTPTAGQCATTATLSVTTDVSITATFTALGPYCEWATPGLLPTVSNNGITGAWSPATINTVSAGTTVYTFTPDPAQCATTTSTMPVTVNSNITPAFAALGPYCVGAAPATLTVTSTNGITGTWSPATINTTSAGTTVYTFTPTAGQCATTTTMSVVVNANITPAFTALGPYCVGATPASLPATSTNGITGTWSPAAINTASAGTTVYTFTPTAGQCATTTTMSVVVDANITPAFTALGPYCEGAAPASLPATSTNGITGTWSPAAINTASAGTTIYTFTPTAGQCATTTTMSVVVDANITPAFTTLGPYCVGATPAILPATSTNGITGTWSPATINTASAGTTVYTFTPTAGQCATTATISVVVDANITPAFTALGPYCMGAAPASLPATSSNGITGTWSPAAINTALAGTTVYTFTPTAGQCATATTMSVVVDANITPAFTALGPYCMGATPASLQATSINGITGIWSPATISTASAGTTVYTFTPTAGQCATTTTMSVTINNNITPSFTTPGPYCAGANPANLPVTSTNGISGTWYPSTINTTSAGTTVYTFTPATGQCATTTAISVVVNANINPAFTTPGPYCAGATPANLPATSTNGISGTWSPSTINTTSAGTTVYTFTPVTGQCALNSTTSVIVNSNPSISLSGTNPKCFGDTNGIIGINISGGNADYNINWNGNSMVISGNSYQINGLTGGYYAVNVSDINGCSGSASYTLVNPSAINISANINDVNCHYGYDGEIILTATGGQTPYYATWDNILTGMHISDLQAGIYAVTVSDNNNCSTSGTYTINQPASLELITETQNITCYGANDGFIKLNASGGNQPYIYSISSDGNTENRQFNMAAAPGNYTLSVEDANGCSDNKSVSISEPGEIFASYNYHNPSCEGNRDGFVEFVVSGGTEPYLYYWNENMITIPLIPALAQGQYSLSISDVNNCIVDLGIATLIDNPVDCIKIPNAFTPNGDGVNDTWIIENIEIFSGAYIQVFNRWGQELWTAKPSENPWDGTFNDKFVPAGTYLYVIDLHNGADVYTGTISVVY